MGISFQYFDVQVVHSHYFFIVCVYVCVCAYVRVFVCMRMCVCVGYAYSGMVIGRDGIIDPSSNLDLDCCVQFCTKALGKYSNSSFATPPTMG